MRWISSVFVTVSLALTGVVSADSIDSFIESEMDRQQIPGLGLLITQDGEIVRSRGYGIANLEHKVPVSDQTIFQSGSVGKQFTAAAVLILADRGKLLLDVPLARYFNQAPSAWHRITARHLLSHTSGLKDYGDEYDYRQDYTDAQLLDVAMQLPLEFEPGTQWSYSNSGYLVLGMLISKLTDAHWSEFVASEVFNPAGMKTAQVINETDIVLNRAAGYERTSEGALVNQEWVSPSFNNLGDGALYFSIRDLAAWDKALSNRKLLSEDSYAAWWTPIKLAGGVTFPYGLGWSINEQRGRRLIEHGGSWQGFKAFLARYDQDNITIAVLANSADANPGLIAHEVAGLLEPNLKLPVKTGRGSSTDKARAMMLRNVLEAWSNWQTHEHMGEALKQTASSSGRETYGRVIVGKQLATGNQLIWLMDDDVSEANLMRRGEQISEIAYYSLKTEEGTIRYRFYLNADGHVVDFLRG